MKHDDLEALRRLLRRGDPAGDGRGPSDEERRSLRTRLRQTAEAARAPGAETPPTGRPPLWRPAVAAASLVALLLALLLVASEGFHLPRTTDPTPEAVGPAGHGETVPEPRPRQIHFTTPGGTRVVWVLYPDRPATEPSDDGRPAGSGNASSTGGTT